MKVREQIMSKLEKRESRRRLSVVSSMVDSVPETANVKKGWSKGGQEDKEAGGLVGVAQSL